MQGLALTYATLATTRNEAAADVLIAALDDRVEENRTQPLSILLGRNDVRAPQQLLARWDRLGAADIAVLSRKKNWIAEAILTHLRDGGEQAETAIAAAEALMLHSAVGELVLLAESSGSRAIRSRASQAVLELVAPLGRDARADRDQPTVRGPILARLADSVRCFAMHRNEQLVDAFLVISTWSDAELRSLVSEPGPALELLRKRFAVTSCEGAIELLAGFIRRRNLPVRIGELIQTRTDEAFRDALLQQISSEPSGTVIRNLRDMGMPKSCRGGSAMFTELPTHQKAPFIHLYVTANDDNIENLHLITTAIVAGEPCCEVAAAIGLARCEVPDTDFWMRAAVPVADGDAESIAANGNAQLLDRLIDLMDHHDQAVVRGVRRILEPLHAEKMLSKMASLRPRTRRRIGRVVMMVDSDAIQRVRDALRHPVLNHRLNAIAMAEALAIVDLLADSFAHITREDHQEARMRAAEAMAEASGEETLKLLQEMMHLPESPVRDAAAKACARRQVETA